MITDIPKENDFKNMAFSLLNVAWEIAVNLALNMDQAVSQDAVVEEAKYWEARQTELTTSISLVQQACEFLLKAKIVAVSPFLLISGSPDKWPKDCDNKDTPFADFYTVDANDLMRMHDAVSASRLPQVVKDLFSELRRKRNAIMHTVDKKLKVEVKEVVVAILEITKHFEGKGNWIGLRRRYLEESSDSLAYDLDGVTYTLVTEFSWVFDNLEPAQIKEYFGFNKKQRRYICPDCWSVCREADLEPRVAILRPNEPTSTTLGCLVCAKDRTVIRKDCQNADCEGNVLDAEDWVCLTCLGENQLPDHT